MHSTGYPLVPIMRNSASRYQWHSSGWTRQDFQSQTHVILTSLRMNVMHHEIGQGKDSINLFARMPCPPQRISCWDRWLDRNNSKQAARNEDCRSVEDSCTTQGPEAKEKVCCSLSMVRFCTMMISLCKKKKKLTTLSLVTCLRKWYVSNAQPKFTVWLWFRSSRFNIMHMLAPCSWRKVWGGASTRGWIGSTDVSFHASSIQMHFGSTPYKGSSKSRNIKYLF
jgi:hypothetical protein